MAKKQKKRVRTPATHFQRIPIEQVKQVAVVDDKTTVGRKTEHYTARTGGSNGN